jgi:hypothetical protein
VPHNRFLLRLYAAIRPLSDPTEIQEVTARLLGEHLRVSRVIYAEINRESFEITRCYASGVAPFYASGSIAAFGTSLLEAGRRGEGSWSTTSARIPGSSKPSVP